MTSRAKEKIAYRSILVDAAVHWWEGKRPVGWSRAQHVATPTVNCAGVRECNLALAVAKLEKVK